MQLTEPKKVEKKSHQMILSSSRDNKAWLSIHYLQVCDNGVLHVFLLFLQEVVADGIQRVRAQFVISQQNLGEGTAKL